MSVVFVHDCVILDACCVVNLYASRHFGHILETIPASVAVAAYVRNEEARKIYGGPDEHVMQREEQIDLQPFIDRGLLTLVSPESEAENVAYVNFAAALDDGEAITGAIAVHRHWAIGTDDRGASPFLQKQLRNCNAPRRLSDPACASPSIHPWGKQAVPCGVGHRGT